MLRAWHSFTYSMGLVALLASACSRASDEDRTETTLDSGFSGVASAGRQSSGTGGMESGGTGGMESGGTGGMDSSGTGGTELGGAGGVESNGGANRGGTHGAGTGGGALDGGGQGGSGEVFVEPCPPQAPTYGDACPKNGSHCSYGKAPLPECREHFVCTGGRWTPSATYSSCNPTPPEACPAKPDSDPCQAGARCVYEPGTICTCATQSCGGTGCITFPQPVFVCNSVDTTRCPARPPNAGTTCSGASSVCAYEGCGLATTCRDGQWVWGNYGCP